MGVVYNNGFCKLNAKAIIKEESMMRMRPKTKIVCTLGPACRSTEIIEELLRAGMNVARFNFSHGTHAYHHETLHNLRAAITNTNIPCAIMLDTKGPEIRTGMLKEGKPIQLKQGQEISISTDYTIKGDENIISMSYSNLARDLKPGSPILCSDGTISLTVLECNQELGMVRCRCENTTLLGERKNVNLPGVVVDLPTLTDKDREDILEWGIPNNIDILALSFVRKCSDLVAVRKLLGHHANSIMLMSKIENQEGMANLDDILANSDGLMVARGDLGMEIPIEKIFLAQKMMIHKCNIQGKPVVTATQMLESMINSPRPTRAEATDVANAVIDGTDCVMLSGETAAGAYPALAVETMARICIEAENSLDYAFVYRKAVKAAPLPMSPVESLACSAVQTANSAAAKLILVVAGGGAGAANLVAKFRPSVPILWAVAGENGGVEAKQALVLRGVVRIKCEVGRNDEEMVELGVKEGEARKLCKQGESVVVVKHAGINSSISILVV